MKRLIDKYLAIIPVAFILISTLFSHSCANTTQAPSGGVKDTIPPVIVKVSPAYYSTNVPLSGVELAFTFNEYVTVKTASNIFLSPPQSKPPKSKVKGKSVIVSFPEALLPNTTYTLDLSGAIADNNEGNMFPGFTYVFSTGETIDSLMITGVVRDCNTLNPVKGATVMLYKDHADSAIFKQRPYAAVRTDDWGFFSLRNIQDTLYRLYAIKDGNNNNIYDPDELELVAFADSLVRPMTVVNDSLPELVKYDMKDTLNCLARHAEYELSLFKEKPSKQQVMKKVRVDERSSYITFMAPNAHIDSLWIKGIPANRLITQFNVRRDSLEVWVNDRRKMPDTLHMYLNYRKTDSLGRLKAEVEHLKVYYQKEEEGSSKNSSKAKTSASKSSKKDIKHEDTLCVYQVTANPQTIEQYGYVIEFKYPIINEAFDSLKLRSINPRQQETQMKFNVIPDSLNIRRFTIMPEEALKQGYDYILKVPHRGFRDINGYYNDSSEVKITLPNDEKLSRLNLVLSGVAHRYIIDLMDEKKSNVIRSYVIDEDCTLAFPYLKSGKYAIRMTIDVNRNTIVDSGSLLEHRQPEKALYYKIKGDDTLLNIPEAVELDQMINLAELFNDKN